MSSQGASSAVWRLWLVILSRIFPSEKVTARVKLPGIKLPQRLRKEDILWLFQTNLSNRPLVSPCGPALKSPFKLVSTRAHDECRGWCFIDDIVFHKAFGLKDMLASYACFNTLS